MAIRSLRVCDKPQCNNMFASVCPLCDQDCCFSHIVTGGESAIRVGVAICNRVFGLVVESICYTCLNVLGIVAPVPSPQAQAVGLPHAPFPQLPDGIFPTHAPSLPLDHVLASVRPAVIEALRAYIAAQALTAHGTAG